VWLPRPGPLLYGEWLRRENRRVDAREQLRARHETFNDVGAEGFAERGPPRLVVTERRCGGALTTSAACSRRKRTDRPAGKGRSLQSRDGAQLFLSPRTVQTPPQVFLKLESLAQTADGFRRVGLSS